MNEESTDLDREDGPDDLTPREQGLMIGCAWAEGWLEGGGDSQEVRRVVAGGWEAAKEAARAVELTFDEDGSRGDEETFWDGFVDGVKPFVLEAGAPARAVRTSVLPKPPKLGLHSFAILAHETLGELLEQALEVLALPVSPDGYGLFQCLDEGGGRWTVLTPDLEYARLVVGSSGVLEPGDALAMPDAILRRGWAEDWLP